MKEENLIHIKLEPSEATQSKKDILATQMGLIKILKSVREYRALRLRELKLKTSLSKKIKELKTNLKELNEIRPHVKVPKEFKEMEVKKMSPKKELSYSGDLESELNQIQKKLKELE
jgi:hypothetical protein